MKPYLVKAKSIIKQPASHEDPGNPGVYKKIMIGKNSVEGALQMVNLAEIPLEKKFRSHFHEDMTELFFIIKGRGLLKAAESEFTVAANDLVVVPARIRHQLVNIGKTTLKYLVFGFSVTGSGKTLL